MNNFFILTTITIIFLTGCTTQVENLKPDEKKLIYKNVQNEIRLQTQKGDLAYATGFYDEAVKAYTMVNFYEAKVVVPLEKIQKIEKQAKVNGKYFYDRALKQIGVDEKKALIELSSMMKNDQNYKDGKILFEQLKSKQSVLISSLENSLKAAISKSEDAKTDLKSVNKALDELIKYDSINPLVSEVKNQLLAEKNILLDEAINLYNQNKLKKSAEKFNIILSIYKSDATAEKYLMIIKNEQCNKQNITQAKESLESKQYIEAIKYANEILKTDSNNTEAKLIIDSANNYCDELVSKLLFDAESYYNDKNLDKALKNFEEVLVIEPQNPTAIIYIKKIKRQLETIKSLE